MFSFIKRIRQAFEEEKKYNRAPCEYCRTWVDKYLEGYDCAGTYVVSKKNLEDGMRKLAKDFEKINKELGIHD